MRPVKNAFAFYGLPILAAVVAAIPAPAAAQGDKPPVAQDLAGFNPAYLDRSADPCQDFDQFACGTWKKNNPVPSDRSSWTSSDVLYLNNLAVLYDILGKTAADDAKRSPIERRIGDYYAACMDEDSIEARGTAPLQDDLARIAQLKDKAALPALIARLHTRGVGAAFDFGSTPDYKKTERTIAQAEQGGLGLPTRDYYTAEDARSKEIRTQYVAHLQKLFELLGDPADKAAAQAQAVMRLESGLAKGTLTPVEARDPEKVYNLLKLADFQALTPSFRWQDYLQGVGAPAFQELNVATPDFFRQLEAQIKGASLDDWKAYLRARVVDAAAPLLPAAFVQQDFAFNAATLSGVKELSPRWRRCIQRVDDHLGEDLGQKYVEVAFGEKSRERMDQLVKDLLQAMERDIKALDWMGEETKKQALTKLARMGDKVGYPRRWRDYSSLQVARGDALGNWRRGEGFELRHQLSKIGKPTDDEEWLITPATVNAYYNPAAN
ncbi:MAG TPA: M13 family metallopeptidase, partial [Thermoanaerobaculia bacterium]|nr:M13 family metallopeptidase [Thermoanaerobaculia bacterium]